MSDEDTTITAKDGAVIIKLWRHRSETGSPLRLAGKELEAARRMAELGMLCPGRLGDRYFDLTPKGQAFVYGYLQHHEDHALL